MATLESNAAPSHSPRGLRRFIRPAIAVGAARFGAGLLGARGRYQRTTTDMPDGTRIATWIGGTTTGRPVVFLHGFCGDHAAMRPLAQAVADKRPVILYDARGHGQSDDFGTPALMQTLAEDLLAVLNAHAPSGADVVGLSMGAQTIFETLRLTGDASFVRFVFIDQSPCIASGPDWPHGLFGEAAAADIAAARAEIAAQPRKLANAWLRGLWRSDERLGMKLLLSPSMLTGLRHVPDATLRLADDMLQQDWRHEVRQLTKPILLLYGGRSIYPGAGRWMADTLPHAELELFESSGHALVLEQPARAARALRRFLTSA